MPYRVLVSDSKVLDLDTEEEVLGEIGARVEPTGAGTAADLIEAAAGADALIVDARADVSADVLDAVDSLRAVGRAGIGVDNVDLEAAARNGVTVVNVPDYSVDEVSTHALGLALACLRKYPTFDRSVKAGAWDWTVGQPIPRLEGSTVGLVAFGKIARRLAAKLRGFNVDVIVHDPYVPAYRMGDFGAESVGFEDLLDRSDVVSIHAPLTDETRGLFDADAFAAMSAGTILVNTARGPIVDEGALLDALDDGTVAAAGLDVRETEPPEDSPLHDRDDVILTPHVGWYSEASRRELSRTVARDVARILQGEMPENPVDPDSGWG